MDILEFKKTTSYHNRHPWELARVKVVLHLLEGKHFKHLLDVGSGDAFVLNELSKENIADEYTAVDTAYEQTIVEKIESNTNDKLRFLQNISQTTADGVLLLDVLEHCADDDAVLKEIIASSKSFSLLITVPAFQSLFSYHDKLLLHERRYNLKQLKDLCNKNNLVIERKGYFFFSLWMIRCLQLFFEKIKLYQPKKTIDNWNAGKKLTAIFTSLLWIDFKIGSFFSSLGINLPGLSAYCLCRHSPS
jgi:hypothetical protein